MRDKHFVVLAALTLVRHHVVTMWGPEYRTTG